MPSPLGRSLAPQAPQSGFVVTHFLVVSDQDRPQLVAGVVGCAAPLQVPAAFQSMLAHGSGVGSPATTSAHQ